MSEHHDAADNEYWRNLSEKGPLGGDNHRMSTKTSQLGHAADVEVSDKVSQLVDMGFTSEEARTALEIAGFDIPSAVHYLHAQE
eukprot:TRINITY_DN146_c0_g1_i3.p1 TRINITY_DN146_c0_g1~~TRINITY_DN146_c0_g1_i3.p1  ORF type:complete len:84 (+),score=16.13 TRINITY_DN146_c0_g1_i3:76-327(+)